jgi:hypothetical protein
MLLQPIKILSPSTQEGSHLVHAALGGHGTGGFTDSNSPEVVRASRETSGPKSKTPTAQTRTANQNMLLQPTDGKASLPSTKDGSHLVYVG